MKKINTKTDYYAPMHANFYYHVFNRTNNKELLFLDDEDRRAFLERLVTYILPYADIFTYCLLGNHFHLLVRVKSLETITGVIENVDYKKRTVTQRAFLEIPRQERTTEKIMEKQFLRLFTSYSMYFNARHRRDGNLFTRRFKRIQVESEGHQIAVVYYIHANPEKHKLMEDFRKYKWSSYLVFLSDMPTKIKREEVLKWFYGKDGFLKYHNERRDFDDDMKKYFLE